MKIAAIGDLHCTHIAKGAIRSLLAGIEGKADMLALVGDLTNTGMIQEMEVLLEELKCFSGPIAAVVGNHDHEQNHSELLVKMMERRGICVLDRSTCVIDGVGFFGTKGFCGGFDDQRIQPFGEYAIKAFVQAGVDEMVAMEKALATLTTRTKVGLLHYAPIRGTLEGESPELFPFLGTSLMADVLDRHDVTVAFHGHAHRGALHGHTPGNVPVYNVSRFARVLKGEPPYLYYEVEGGSRDD
jgi:Icc-related predicted phosphoesterase